jgi:hypothetical protein
VPDWHPSLDDFADAGVTGMEEFTMQELQGWRLPPRFQRKSSPSKESKCATESDFLPADPKKEMHEAIRVMLKKKWRPQEVRDARNMQ